MSLSELRSLEELLTGWIVALDSTQKPTEAYAARQVRSGVEDEIGLRERYNEKTLSE